MPLGECLVVGCFGTSGLVCLRIGWFMRYVRLVLVVWLVFCDWMVECGLAVVCGSLYFRCLGVSWLWVCGVWLDCAVWFGYGAVWVFWTLLV